ncbi:MAG: hypothetical protein OEL91_10545 [Burkholderiaceae bacterium]|nr:hypothetical protein [Burkholderiaceae bacterium]
MSVPRSRKALLITEADPAENLPRGAPPLGIGEDTLVHHAILDKDVRIGRNVQIVNAGRWHDHDGSNFKSSLPRA